MVVCQLPKLETRVQFSYPAPISHNPRSMFDVNNLAVFVSGVAAMAVGFLWYGPLFGKVWMKHMRFSKEDMDKAKAKGMAKSYVLMFIAALVTAFVLAQVFVEFNVSTVVGGLTGALWMWLGFMATKSIGVVLWEGKSWNLWVLNALHDFISLAVMGVILALW